MPHMSQSKSLLNLGNRIQDGVTKRGHSEKMFCGKCFGYIDDSLLILAFTFPVRIALTSISKFWYIGCHF